jgi:hypothetical protein
MARKVGRVIALPVTQYAAVVNTKLVELADTKA